MECDNVDYNEKYYKLRKSLPINTAIPTLVFNKSRFIKRCEVCLGLDNSKKVLLTGYKDDVDALCKSFRKNGYDVDQFLFEPKQFVDDESIDYYGSERLDRLSGLKGYDYILICTREIRFLIQMILYTKDTSERIIDVYDWYELFFGRKMVINIDMHAMKVNGENSHMRKVNNVAKPLANHTSFGRKRLNSGRFCFNYDACYVHRHSMIKAKSKAEYRFFLEKVIGDLYEIKDIKNLKFYLKKYSNDFGKKESKVNRFLYELDQLFDEMVHEINKNEGIVVFWTDAISQREADDWDFLGGLKERALRFNNTYTSVPYTDTVVHSFLTGEGYFEDKVDYVDGFMVGDCFRNDNMPLIDVLKDYKMIEIGARYIDLHRPGKPITSYKEKSSAVYKYRPSTLSFFEALCVAAVTEKSFLLIHADCEPHHPYWSPMGKVLAIGKSGLLDDPEDNREQRREALKYLDEEVSWYTKFFSDEKYKKVYLGDHGKGIPAYSNNRIKPYCFVTGNGIDGKNEDRLFSYFNFYKLIRYLISNNKDDYERIFSEYVIIENQDPYSNKFVNEIKKHFSFGTDSFMDKYYLWGAFRGYIDKKYKIIRFRNGDIKLYNSSDDSEIDIDSIDETKYEDMLVKVGDCFENLNMNKLKNAKEFFELCDKKGYQVI